MTHHMSLQHKPFTMIADGKKTIELRLYDEKRRAINVGDSILFTDTTTGEQTYRKVAALHIFKTFEQLYSTLPLTKCGYTKEELPAARASDMYLYYTPEQESRYGVIGIELG